MTEPFQVKLCCSLLQKKIRLEGTWKSLRAQPGESTLQNS